MQGRTYHLQNINNSLSVPRLPKQVDTSISTSGSSSPSHSPDSENKSSIQTLKVKSQLCKKFMQNGFCPYEKKCKFAHGCHELRRNQQVNSKYKTKQCGVFITQGYCPYGQRCNFIHRKVQLDCEFRQVDEDLIQILSQVRTTSRLMKLLE